MAGIGGRFGVEYPLKCVRIKKLTHVLGLMSETKGMECNEKY